MIDDEIRTGLEAILFLADEPLDLATLADTLELDRDEVATAVADLAARYDAADGGITIRQRAGGWRMYTTPAAHPVVERYLLAGKSGRLTQAALETLAVIAYKQPISRQEVSDIRGVNADGAVRSLVVRGFIEEAGRDPGPGQAILYGTTSSFLEKLGLDSLEDLPPLTDFLPEAPAPDEPAADRLRDARKRLASGGDLPSTGAARWDADPRTNTGEDAPQEEGDDALPPMAARADRREQDNEMDELTARLETAARSAMTQLREAVAATEGEDEDEDEDATESASDGDTGSASDGDPGSASTGDGEAT